MSAQPAVNWFPGHMAKGMRVISSKLSSVDLVLEVRDARLPLSSLNPSLAAISKHVHSVPLFNKIDLAELPVLQKARNDLMKLTHCHTPIFLEGNSPNPKQFASIRRLVKEIHQAKIRPLDPNPEIRMMVVGMPNVGKSTIINTLRAISGGRTKAVKTGALPGVTRSVAGLVLLYDEPKTYLIDTPGVMIPNVKDMETGMKLALSGAVKDDVVGIQVIADFLLKFLNSRGNTRYIEEYSLSGPGENLPQLLDDISLRIGALRHGGEKDHDVAAFHFVKAFRAGKFGRFVLDDLSPESFEKRKTEINEAKYWSQKKESS